MIRSCDNAGSPPHLRHDSEHILISRAETWRVILINNQTTYHYACGEWWLGFEFSSQSFSYKLLLALPSVQEALISHRLRLSLYTELRYDFQ